MIANEPQLGNRAPGSAVRSGGRSTVEPRGPDDADVLLVTPCRDWAAWEGAPANADAISRQIEGSVAGRQPGADRPRQDQVLGSATMQA